MTREERAAAAKEEADEWRAAKILYMDPPADLSLSSFAQAKKMLGDALGRLVLFCGPGHEDVIAALHAENLFYCVSAPQILKNPSAWSLGFDNRIVVSLPKG